MSSKYDVYIYVLLASVVAGVGGNTTHGDTRGVAERVTATQLSTRGQASHRPVRYAVRLYGVTVQVQYRTVRE